MRRQERAVHELPSFARYLNKVFDFRAAVAGLQDSRRTPEIPPSAVFLGAFHAFVFRLPSFQQCEAELSQPPLQRWVGVERAFRDDTLRDSLSGFSVEGLEAMLAGVNRTLKRNKVFDAGCVQGHIVAALDGVEVLSSYSRCCDSCLERRVTARQGGVKVERQQYYHRAVGCQIVSSPVKSFVAVEWLQPGEGEETAALRLLRKLPDLYGSSFFDILLLDALYAQTAVLDLAQEVGWEVVISLTKTKPARSVSVRDPLICAPAGRRSLHRAARRQQLPGPTLGHPGSAVLGGGSALGARGPLRRNGHGEALPQRSTPTGTDFSRMAVDHDARSPGFPRGPGSPLGS